MRLLTEIARMYHDQGIRQPQIAAQLNVSQARVSRLLKKAVELGIVRTIVVSPAGLHADVEQAIEAKYGLREVVIADTGDEQDEQLLLPAPGLVSSKRTLRALVSDPGIQSVFTAYESLSLLLVGIGSLAPSPLLQPSGNAVADADQQLLRAAGAVGDVCLRFFDDNGAHVRTLHDRVVGIGAAALRAVPRRVGVAGGLRKVSAIDAALRGGWVNVLVTDYQVATRLAEGRDA